MKAAVLIGYANQKVEYETDVPLPTINDGQILAEVFYAGLNPYDIKVLNGINKDKLRLPAVLGGDFSGKVMKVSYGVNKYSVGDYIFGSANPANGKGSFAEFAPVSPAQIALLNPNLAFDKAAAIPLVGCSAYQAILDNIKLKEGQSILIHGGAGGIGSMAIQLAKKIGAFVYSTASTKDLDYVKKLGADKVIDYKKDDFLKLIKNIDAVIDIVGGEVRDKSYQIIKPGGTLLSLAASENVKLSKKYNINFIYQNSKVTTEKLELIQQDILDGYIKVQIDSVYELKNINLAFNQINKHHRGKIIIKVK